MDGLAKAAGHADRAIPLKSYCTGFLLPGERKSVESMAARLAGGIARDVPFRRCNRRHAKASADPKQHGSLRPSDELRSCLARADTGRPGGGPASSSAAVEHDGPHSGQAAWNPQRCCSIAAIIRLLAGTDPGVTFNHPRIGGRGRPFTKAKPWPQGGRSEACS